MRMRFLLRKWAEEDNLHQKQCDVELLQSYVVKFADGSVAKFLEFSNTDITPDKFFSFTPASWCYLNKNDTIEPVGDSLSNELETIYESAKY